MIFSTVSHFPIDIELKRHRGTPKISSMCQRFSSPPTVLTRDLEYMFIRAKYSVSGDTSSYLEQCSIKVFKVSLTVTKQQTSLTRCHLVLITKTANSINVSEQVITATIMRDIMR